MLADRYNDFSGRYALMGTGRNKNLNKPIGCIFMFHATI
jgi:hypothetical protein